MRRSPTRALGASVARLESALHHRADEGVAVPREVAVLSLPVHLKRRLRRARTRETGEDGVRQRRVAHATVRAREGSVAGGDHEAYQQGQAPLHGRHNSAQPQGPRHDPCRCSRQRRRLVRLPPVRACFSRSFCSFAASAGLRSSALVHHACCATPARLIRFSSLLSSILLSRSRASAERPRTAFRAGGERRSSKGHTRLCCRSASSSAPMGSRSSSCGAGNRKTGVTIVSPVPGRIEPLSALLGTTLDPL